MRSRIIIPREVLLVEIERRCPDAECNARTRTGLTKEEARTYCGFKCERCGRSWDDVLTERDVPEWWEELTITGLYTVRENKSAEPDDQSEVVTRMSESFRRAPESAQDEAGEESV
ncbi:MAG: hypothetical protein QOJ02_1591 [Acidobacteriota bacterium]|jgi:hypothetical protein|nr:hypothetical protein [Acidobacteriota bacterium]